MVVEVTRQFFVKHGLEPCAIAAAVSGGTDSTALLLALAELRREGFDVSAAHVNHHLRGEESDADEAFVRMLCARIGVPVGVADGTLDPERVRARGIEAAAREARYARLRELAGTRLIATAHQHDDQAETVLMRLLTGSGLAGLRGIHPVREDGFIRPLLDVPRAALAAFVAQRGITPRHDRSNDDPRFLRNRVRAILGEFDAREHLAGIAARARAQWPILERALDDVERASAIVERHQTRFVRWPEDVWLRQALLHRHIHRLDPHARDVSARDLARLANEPAKRVSVTKTLEWIRIDDALVLRRVPEKTPPFELEVTPDEPAFIEAIDAVLRVTQNRANHGQRFQLPRDAQPRFQVRNRRRGDRFQPLGMREPKKLKDFLIDRKIAADLRDRLPLLVWNGEIVWVAGVEVSEKFKVTSPAVGPLYEAWLEAPGDATGGDRPGIQR